MRRRRRVSCTTAAEAHRAVDAMCAAAGERRVHVIARLIADARADKLHELFLSLKGTRR